MSKAKQLRKRIKSVKNTRKITKTMEMVAASKMKRAQDRVTKARPYVTTLLDMMSDLSSEIPPELIAEFPLLERREPVKRVLLLVVTADRGLCGAYNANVIRHARLAIEEEKAAGREVELHVAGRKGISFFRFRNYELAGAYPNLADRPTFDDGDKFADVVKEAFLSGRVDQVKVVFAQFQSAMRQPPTTLNLLPIEPVAQSNSEGSESSETPKKTRDIYEFEPDPTTILETLFPLYMRTSVFQVLLEATASEHSARRMAMKNATDNADDLTRSLTLSFNKARQAQITQEIAEIVSGAAAVE